MPESAVEAHTLSNLHTACIMAVKPIITAKIALFFWKPRKKWIKSLLNLHGNHHPGKSTTPCSGTLTTNNTPHLILRYFHHKHTKTPMPKLWPITNPTSMQPPTIINIHQFHK
jgi:hypothetical protein